MKTHLCLTLRGSCVEKGIKVSNALVPFVPRWGMTRGSSNLLSATSAPNGSVDTVHIAVTEHGVVLFPAEGIPEQELVLVQEYCPGAGGKRNPSFQVAYGPEVRVLSDASTSGGSGGEKWVLVSAPMGWAQNIASQFVDRKDTGTQTISFNPAFKAQLEEESVPMPLPTPVFSSNPTPRNTTLADAFKKAGFR